MATTGAKGLRCLLWRPTWTSVIRTSHPIRFCNVYLPTLGRLPVKSAGRVSSPLMLWAFVDLRSPEVSEAAEAVTWSWGITTKSSPSGTLKTPARGCRAAQPRLFFCCKAHSRCLNVTREGTTTVTAKWNIAVTLCFPLTIVCVSPSPGRKSFNFSYGEKSQRETQQMFYSQQLGLCYFFWKGTFYLIFFALVFTSCFFFSFVCEKVRIAERNLEQRVKW